MPTAQARLVICAIRENRETGAYVESGVRGTGCIQITEHALEGACCREVRVKIRVLPVRQSCGGTAVTQWVSLWLEEDPPGTMSF